MDFGAFCRVMLLLPTVAFAPNDGVVTITKPVISTYITPQNLIDANVELVEISYHS